jgi:hypothetical protein
MTEPPKVFVLFTVIFDASNHGCITIIPNFTDRDPIKQRDASLNIRCESLPVCYWKFQSARVLL